MSAYTELKTKITDVVNDDSNPIGKLFSTLEAKTGVKRTYLLLGFIAFLVLYLAIGYGTQLLSNVIGFLYPAYASMRAIESPDDKDDTKWLTYWVVFSLFAVLEYPFAFVLSYIPLYYLLKCVFFAWCFLPVMNGANTIYEKFLRPYFVDLDKDVKKAAEKLANEAVKGVLKGE